MAPVLTPTPLATPPTPWSIVAVPPLKVAVRVLDPPLVTAPGEAVKDAITGAGTTVTAAMAEAEGVAVLVAITW